MSISSLQNNTNINTAYETTGNSSVKNSSSNTNTGFGDVLVQSSSPAVSLNAPTNWLTTPSISDEHRPNVKQFMDATGLSANDASEFIYGVVGSNTDTRNWQAIMSSSDPVKAVRSATNAMYNRSDTPPKSVLFQDMRYMQPADTVAKAGNFAIRELKDEKAQVIDTGLKIVASDGLILRDAGNTSKSIQKNAWLFGIDTSSLNKLAPAAPAQIQCAMLEASAESSVNIAQQVHSLTDAVTLFLSTHGLASG